jgi:hypothetical protein
MTVFGEGSDMSNTNLMQYELSEKRPSAVGGLRITGQILGGILILIGMYFSVLILIACVGVLRDPGQTGTSVAAMSKIIGMEGAQVTSGKDHVQIGRAVAGVLLLLWYVVASSIALKLIAVGGRMITGVAAERREFLAAMKEFIIFVRNQK